jgi:hypothetical protein
VARGWIYRFLSWLLRHDKEVDCGREDEWSASGGVEKRGWWWMSALGNQGSFSSIWLSMLNDAYWL